MQKEQINQPRRYSLFKELREEAGLTQEQLAYSLKKAASTIRRWEAGGEEPKMTRAEWADYCKVIGKSFDELPPLLGILTESQG
jgi:DNA-binding XRE family transcriptional regulator